MQSRLRIREPAGFAIRIPRLGNIFLQDIFFSLFDSATKVTIYLISTVAALFANAYLLLRDHATHTPRFTFKAHVLRGTLVAVVFVWSFWSFVSSIVSISMIWYGLPLLWLTYSLGNAVNLVCIAMIVISFIKRLEDTGAIRTIPRFFLRIDEIFSNLRAPLVISAIVAGLWATAYTVLYTLGTLIL
jgi:hypothetical protein